MKPLEDHCESWAEEEEILVKPSKVIVYKQKLKMSEKFFHSVQPQWAQTACRAERLSPMLGDIFWKTCGSTVESPEETTKIDQESRKEVNKPCGEFQPMFQRTEGRINPNKHSNTILQKRMICFPHLWWPRPVLGLSWSNLNSGETLGKACYGKR